MGDDTMMGAQGLAEARDNLLAAIEAFQRAEQQAYEYAEARERQADERLREAEARAREITEEAERRVRGLSSNQAQLRQQVQETYSGLSGVMDRLGTLMSSLEDEAPGGGGPARSWQAPQTEPAFTATPAAAGHGVPVSAHTHASETAAPTTDAAQEHQAWNGAEVVSEETAPMPAPALFDPEPVPAPAPAPATYATAGSTSDDPVSALRAALEKLGHPRS